MVKWFSGDRRFLERFQDGCEKDITLNWLTIGILEKFPVDKEPKAPKITVKPDAEVELEKGWYHVVYAMQYFTKDDGFYRTEDHADMESDPDEEEMENMILDNKTESH